MTTLELQNKKVELASQILTSDNEEIINQLSKLYTKLTKKQFPCDYTIEEIAQACEGAVQDYEAGKLIPLSEIKRKIS